MTHKISSDGAAAIAPEIKYLPVNDHTPVGVKMILAERAQGIAFIRTRRKGDGFDLWLPLPTIPAVEK